MSIFLKATTAKTTVIREGIKIVRKVIAANDFSEGVSTAELYQLALREPVPKGFQGDSRLIEGPGGIKGITLPPQNDHPIRSKMYVVEFFC
jgi:hypothetical protein